LHILDEKTVVFAAGSVVLILDLQTKAQTFIRSTSGGGIGAIAVRIIIIIIKKYFFSIRLLVALRGHLDPKFNSIYPYTCNSNIV